MECDIYQVLKISKYAAITNVHVFWMKTDGYYKKN